MQENLFDKEDYRYKIYELFNSYESGDLPIEVFRDKLLSLYQEIYDGAVSKSEQLATKNNPFFTLWNTALQEMPLQEYETAISNIRAYWSDFMDYFFSLWYLRRAENLLNKKSEPLYR